MRWRIARLYELAETGARDVLNDRVREVRPIGEAMVRATPYGGTSAESESNPYTDGPMTFATPAAWALVRRAAYAELGGERMRVTGRADLGRMRVITLAREE